MIDMCFNASSFIRHTDGIVQRLLIPAIEHRCSNRDMYKRRRRQSKVVLYLPNISWPIVVGLYVLCVSVRKDKRHLLTSPMYLWANNNNASGLVYCVLIADAISHSLYIVVNTLGHFSRLWMPFGILKEIAICRFSEYKQFGKYWRRWFVYIVGA